MANSFPRLRFLRRRQLYRFHHSVHHRHPHNGSNHDVAISSMTHGVRESSIRNRYRGIASEISRDTAYSGQEIVICLRSGSFQALPISYPDACSVFDLRSWDRVGLVGKFPAFTPGHCVQPPGVAPHFRDKTGHRSVAMGRHRHRDWCRWRHARQVAGAARVERTFP